MIEYASAVAIEFDGSIRFGVVAEIVETTNEDGTRKSYGVDLYVDGDKHKHRHVENDGDGIVELPSRSYTGYRELDKFVERSPGYKWALDESERRAKAVEDAKAEERRKYIAEREAARAIEATAGTGTHSAGDPADPRNDADVPL